MKSPQAGTFDDNNDVCIKKIYALFLVPLTNLNVLDCKLPEKRGQVLVNTLWLPPTTQVCSQRKSVDMVRPAAHSHSR